MLRKNGKSPTTEERSAQKLVVTMKYGNPQSQYNGRHLIRTHVPPSQTAPCGRQNIHDLLRGAVSQQRELLSEVVPGFVRVLAAVFGGE